MADEQNSARPYRKAFWWLLGAVFVFRLWFIRTLPLSGDEAYHWEWSRHLAFGYYDHPGLTAWLIRAFTSVFGRSTEFTVRLPALVMLTLTVIVCRLFARYVMRTHGASGEAVERAGFMAGLLVLAAPVFFWFSGYISTDPPLIFFWALTLYLLFRAFDRGGWLVWIAAGVCMGLALMSKFLSFLIVPPVVVFALASPSDRAWFRRPQPYVAAACALLVWTPFLWWNATHGWDTFMFNFVHRQRDQGFAPLHALELVGSQALALSPGLFVLAILGLGRCAADWKTTRDRAALFLGLSAALPLAYFLYVGFSRRVGLHWPAAGWLPALVCLSCWWAAEAQKRPALDRWMKGSVALAVALIAAVLLLLHIPPGWAERIATWRYPGSPKRISVKQHVERFGWRELGRRVGAVYDEMAQARGSRPEAGRGEESSGVFITCGEYGFASMVAFYTPGQLPAHLWAGGGVHGLNYRYWDDFPSLKGMDAIYVAKREEKAEAALAGLRERFREVGALERLPIMADGQEVRAFYLIRCRGFDGRAPTWKKSPPRSGDPL